MPKITPKHIFSIQSRIKRGTKVKVNDIKLEKSYQVEFDGFDDVECPYRYCELNPRNPQAIKNEKSCDGFMKWVLPDKKEIKSCPYLGGNEFTVSDSQIVTHIIVKKQKSGTDEIVEELIEPSKF